MKRFVRAAGVVAFLIAIHAGLAWSQSVEAPTSTDAVQTTDGKQLYFVEFATLPTADGGDLSTILADQATFRAAAAQSNIHYTETKSFHTLWNGLTIALDPKDLGKLRGVGGVSGLYPVIQIALSPDDAISEPDLATALSMTGADVAQNTLGLSGAGVKVGIIDTGQDYDHPDLGGDGTARTNSSMFPNARDVAGYDFVGDAWVPGATPVPDPYPDDCNGHGTHVSGIVGANGAVKGVAPGASFGVYKVFGCGTTTSSDIMIQAMEMAYADGMNVINMSIGAALQWPSYPTAAVATRLVSHGIVVVTSAGNSSGLGLYATGAPGVGGKVISVASFDNTFTNQNALTVSPDGHAIGYNAATGAPPPPLSGTYPITKFGTPTSTADGCAGFPAGSLTGKVVLIRRGTCTFYTKARNAQLAGAVGVILYNNAAGQLNPTVAGTPPVTIPVVAITAADGALLNSRIDAGPTTITWTSSIVSLPNATGGFISSFSSLGVAPDLSVKPDIGAPGGLIRSSVPIEQGSYAIFSGTSMSSPHVAGAAALVLEAHPNTPSNAMRDVLMNSADAHNFSSAIPFLDFVHHQGAGMLDIPGAVLANTRIEPGKLSLGETSGGSATQSITIRNNSDHTITYTLDHSPALATGPNTFTVSLINAPSTVSFSANPVTVPAGGSASVDVTVTPNAGLAARSLFTGYIDVMPDDGGADYSVPYAGFNGDYQSIPTLTSAGFGFPWLAKRVGSNLVNQPSGATYTMSGTDAPIFVFHLDHPASLLRMEVFEAVGGKSWHRILNQKDIRRNAAPTSNPAGSDFFFTVTWDGSTFHGSTANAVPNGAYVVKITVVRALGDESNPAHVETWTSPVVTLARPDISLLSLQVSQGSVEAGDQVTLSAAVRNVGADPQPGVHVDFLDNGVVIGSAVVDLAGGETQTVTSPWTVGDAAQHHLQAKVTPLETEESYANNDMAIDVTLGQPIVGVGGNMPKVLSFAPAKPNPSSGRVAFRFSLPAAGPVALEVFDVTGRRLKTWRWSSLDAGDYSIDWDGRTESGRSVAAGTLLLRLNAVGRTLTQKAVRIR